MLFKNPIAEKGGTRATSGAFPGVPPSGGSKTGGRGGKAKAGKGGRRK